MKWDKNKILNSHELYEVVLENKEYNECKEFIKWIFSMMFSERLQFLKDMEKECFTYDSWIKFVNNNWK